MVSTTPKRRLPVRSTEEILVVAGDDEDADDNQKEEHVKQRQSYSKLFPLSVVGLGRLLIIFLVLSLAVFISKNDTTSSDNTKTSLGQVGSPKRHPSNSSPKLLSARRSDPKPPRRRRPNISSSSPATGGKPAYVTAYLEPPSTLLLPAAQTTPLPRRSTSRSLLTTREFPRIRGSCATLTQELGTELVNFAYATPTTTNNNNNTNGTTTNEHGVGVTNNMDPYLPWIHDYFVVVSPHEDCTPLRLQFVAQNRRNCNTGKDRADRMAFWAPQMALFQPVPVVRTDYRNGTSRFRLYGEGLDPVVVVSTNNSTTTFPPRQPQAGAQPGAHPHEDILQEQVIPETRFLCRFHWNNDGDHRNENDDPTTHDATSSITHSTYNFNYEYVSWRKKSVMLVPGSTKRSEFWNSQLLFSCPIPPAFRSALGGPVDSTSTTVTATTKEQPSMAPVLVDVIPIRTPPRVGTLWLAPHMVGPATFSQIKTTAGFFNLEHEFGTDHVLPTIADSGRWANLPVCPRESIPTSTHKGVLQNKPPTSKKPHRMVLCTWTSASYHRRGEDQDQQPLNDNALRLREWLIFHKLVGFDHVYIYDNSPIDDYSTSPLYQLVQEFDPSFVTHHPWPATICNNHRPGHTNPGDRSSQYAAEASCRERYGPLTDWMSFIDTDEYLTPMKVDDGGESTTWNPVLDDMERRGVAIMKFKSGRNFPRIHLLDPLANQNACGDPVTERFLKGIEPEPCLTPRQGETFLRVYNCDSIKRPRPERFQRAMKQIYRPDYVLSHFVHYSTVTEFNARYYDPNNLIPGYLQKEKFDPSKEVFVDEIKEGTLIHARSVSPHETMFRSTICQVNYKKMNCFLGYECPDSVDWMDDMGRAKGAKTKTNMNPHHDENGNFCSCWVNDHVEEYWIPKLEQGLAQHFADLNS